MATSWYDIGDRLLRTFPVYNVGRTIYDVLKNTGGQDKIWQGLSGQASANAIKEANERNIQNQNYWNEITMQREDTAMQRKVADLQAAGLNPWLSISGQGAPAAQLTTATADAEDGSQILRATSAMTLLALMKLITKL